MAYIITGGAGFVGSNMVKKLNEKGITDIIIIDSYGNEKMKNLLGLKFSNFIDYKDGIEMVSKHLEGVENPEAFFHIGANADVLVYDPKVMMNDNYEFSKMYCDYATIHNIPFIYASSSAVYGNRDKQGTDNQNEEPHNTYAWSKWLFDQYIIANEKRFSNKVIGFRFFNVFGWGEFHKGKNANIVYRFYQFIKEKNFIDLFNKEIIRDHIWVEDVTEVMYQAMDKPDLKNGIYNLGGNHPISHKYVAEVVVSTMIEEGVIPKGRINDYIKLIDIPAEFSEKIQFYTHADDQLQFISDIAKDNDRKMADYIRRLIKENK
ncbi:MAG: NAD-dependent epimerase/dehydratase family protein [Prevotella sp.]